MKKFLLIIFTVALAYIVAYYTTDKSDKKQSTDLFYKIKCLITGEVDTTDANSLQDEAFRLFATEEYSEAIEYFQKTIETDSTRFYLNYDIAKSYLAMEDTNQAIKTLLSSRYQDKNNNEALILLAEIYLNKKDTAKAVKYLTESNEIYESYIALNYLSQIYLNKKDYRQAKIYIDKALAIFPDDVSLLENKRQIFLAMNMPDSASIYYKLIKSSDPDFYPDYANLATQAKNESKTRKAINYYSLALEEEPDNQEYLNERGWLYSELEMYDSAYYDFNKLVQLEPASYYNYFCRAYVLDYFDSIQEAIRDYKISLKYKDDYKYTYNNLGYEYYRLKDFKNAEKYYSQCIDLDPEYFLAIYNRGILYYDFAKYKKAIDDFKTALANSPDNTGVILYMAKTYEQLKDNVKALDYYNEFIRLSGDDIDSTDYNFVIKRIAKLSAE
ncbi:MAG: tetratricopeptide repeat protein [Bacteroidales bacterium]|nr:tetratricopeptide repeat protein [Bacteroidales bacterium]